MVAAPSWVYVILGTGGKAKQRSECEEDETGQSVVLAFRRSLVCIEYESYAASQILISSPPLPS